jgi:hypothetical protein
MIPMLHKLDLTDLSVDTFSTTPGEMEASFLYANNQTATLGEPLTDCMSSCGFTGSVDPY